MKQGPEEMFWTLECDCLDKFNCWMHLFQANIWRG